MLRTSQNIGTKIYCLTVAPEESKKLSLSWHSEICELHFDLYLFALHLTKLAVTQNCMASSDCKRWNNGKEFEEVVVA